jgi:hypothetical protein
MGGTVAKTSKRLIECPACGTKSHKKLVAYSGDPPTYWVHICEECARFATIAGTPLSEVQASIIAKKATP